MFEKAFVVTKTCKDLETSWSTPLGRTQKQDELNLLFARGLCIMQVQLKGFLK